MTSKIGKAGGVLLASLLIVVAAGFTAPQSSYAAEALPELKGTTYGKMASSLQEKLDRLNSASGSAKERAQTELIKALVRENVTMIRMIDAIHDQVNGLAQGRSGDRLLTRGQKKFEGISKDYSDR